MSARSKDGKDGNLRDFSIHEYESYIHSQERTASSSASKPQIQQETRTKTSMNEWSSLSGNPNVDDLWPSWEEELQNSKSPLVSSPQVSKKINVDEELKRSSATQNPTAKVTKKSPASAAAPTTNNTHSTISPSPTTSLQSDFIAWSARLALEERRMEQLGVVDFTNQYQKHEVLKSLTLEFMTLLYKSFREHVEIFNDNRRSSQHSMSLFRVSNTEADFMLFRNGVKLLVTGQRAGKIVFAFSQYLGQLFAPSQTPSLEVEANWGPFDQLFWSYKGERIAIMDIVRYFFTEFSKQSFR